MNEKTLAKLQKLRLLSVSVLCAFRYGTGQLTHNLNLCSVYQHGEKDNYSESEVTTHQGSWVTVDYIFYRFVVHYQALRVKSVNH
jgi:hypothetical protein